MEYQRNSTRRIGGTNNTRNNQIRITSEMSPYSTNERMNTFESACGCGNSRETRETDNNSRWGNCGCGNSRESRETDNNSRWGNCGCGNSRESREIGENSRSGGCGCGNSRESREIGENSRSGSCGCGNSRMGGCGCGNSRSDMNDGCHNSCLRGSSLAMVYSPCQQFDNLYDTAEGLCRGTIFRELDKPFWGGRK